MTRLSYLTTIIVLIVLSLSVQTRSTEGSEDDGLCVSFYLLHHFTGVSQAGQSTYISYHNDLNRCHY